MRKVFTVTAETSRELVVELEKVLPWRERYRLTADTHVHFLSPATALLEGAAEGVNIINLLASQWGELATNAGDYDGRNNAAEPERQGATASTWCGWGPKSASMCSATSRCSATAAP